jgi:hypothetical protein
LYFRIVRLFAPIVSFDSFDHEDSKFGLLPEFTHHLASARPIFIVAPAFTHRFAHERPEFGIITPACTHHFAYERPEFGIITPAF